MNKFKCWCVICGEPIGECECSAPYTDDIDEAYKVWLAQKRKKENDKQKN